MFSMASDQETTTGGLKFHIVHAPENSTVPKKCYCTQTKNSAAASQSQKIPSGLLWLDFSPLQHLDVSLTCHKGTHLVFGLLQQDNTDQLNKFGPTSSTPELLDKKIHSSKIKTLH